MEAAVLVEGAGALDDDVDDVDETVESVRDEDPEEDPLEVGGVKGVGYWNGAGWPGSSNECQPRTQIKMNGFMKKPQQGESRR